MNNKSKQNEIISNIFILSFSTVTSALNIAVSKNDLIIDKYFNVDSRGSLTNLIPQIQKLLHKNKLRIKDIDLLATPEGPGSFTGIRIALATLKGLAISINSKIVTFNTFEIMSYPYINQNKIIVCLVKAGRNKFFVSAYKNKKQITKFKNKSFALEEVCKNFFLYKNLKIVGDLNEEEKLFLKNSLQKIEFGEKKFSHFLAENICFMAYQRYQKNIVYDISKINKIKPIYYLLSQAEIKLKERNKKQLSS